MSWVFPKGIKHEKLKLSGKYQQIITMLPSFDQSVQKLERICSLIFASIFLFFMAAIGIIVYNIFIGLLVYSAFVIFPFLEAFNEEINVILTIFILVTVSFYLIDFLSLGYLKRIPYFRKLYYPVYLFMSAITLAPLYRIIYYGLVSNLNRFYIFTGLLLYTAATIFISYTLFDSNNFLVQYNTLAGDEIVFAGNYENIFKDNPSNVIQIQSDIVKDQVLRVFLVYNTWHFDYFESKYGWEKYENIAAVPDSVLFTQINLEFLLQLDEVTVENLSWHRHNRDKTNQYGFLTWIDIGHLDRGEHCLKLIRSRLYAQRDTIPVEFFKEFGKIKTAASNFQ
jgi:hypothetical protein